MSARRVIVTCQVFYPDDQSTSQLLSDVLGKLADLGYKIAVITGFPAAASSDVSCAETWRGIDIRRVGLRVAFRRTLVRRALAYASYSILLVCKLAWGARMAPVVTVTNPPFAPILAWLVCRANRQRYVVMLQDIYPDGLVAVGQLRSSGFLARTWAVLNRYAFRSAEEIWVLGRDMESLVRDRYAVDRCRIRYVPHWSPVEAATARAKSESKLCATLRLQHKFVVQYSGNMGLWHDIETLVHAAGLLRNRSDIHFLMIGDGVRKKGAEQIGNTEGLTNLTWLPFQPREKLDDSLACCDVALISQRAGLEGVAVPCKLYGILSSGRAIVGQVPEDSETAMVLREERCGLVVVPGDARSLADAICSLANAPANAHRMGEAAFSAYKRKYTLAAGVQAFQEGFRRLGVYPDCDQNGATTCG